MEITLWQRLMKLSLVTFRCGGDYVTAVRRPPLRMMDVYMLYTSAMEKMLEQTGIFFTLQHMQHKDMVELRLPRLASAGDLILLAHNLSDMKKLIIACEAAAARL